MPAIINDGHSIDFCLKAENGDDFYGTRRPTLGFERSAVSARARRASDFEDWKEHAAAYNDLIVKKLVWWNVKGADDSMAPITAENVGLLNPDLWDRLLSVVMGYSWGDLPKHPTAEQKAEFDKALAAQKAGLAPGDVIAEGARKN